MTITDKKLEQLTAVFNELKGDYRSQPIPPALEVVIVDLILSYQLEKGLRSLKPLV